MSCSEVVAPLTGGPNSHGWRWKEVGNQLGTTNLNMNEEGSEKTEGVGTTDRRSTEGVVGTEVQPLTEVKYAWTRYNWELYLQAGSRKAEGGLTWDHTITKED